MCQYQLSSLMLPSDAPMPPCAATVCERVGKTFDSTATDRPASPSCSDARMPEPPAPTITASKRRRGSLLWIATIGWDFGSSATSHSPENDDRVRDARDQPDDGRELQEHPQTRRLDVIHPDVAH